jgi:hypothetical protein
VIQVYLTRPKHPKDRLYELHGSLLDIKCSNMSCDYINNGNTTEPLCPVLAGDGDKFSSFSSNRKLQQLKLHRKLKSRLNFHHSASPQRGTSRSLREKKKNSLPQNTNANPTPAKQSSNPLLPPSPLKCRSKLSLPPTSHTAQNAALSFD